MSSSLADEAGRDDDAARRLREAALYEDFLDRDGPVVPPIVQTSLFTFSSVAQMCATFSGAKTRPVYSRGLNPTVRIFEEKVARLEGAEDAIALSSGMAAISSAVLSVVEPGDRIVAVRNLYPDAYRFFETLLARFRIEVQYVDGRDLDAIARALAGAKALYLESPTSWLFEALDVERLAGLARDAGATSLIDNSWATPLLQVPHDLGVDLVIHSASKYLGGHSDVVAGVVAGSAERVERIRSGVAPYLGPKLSPMEGWLLVRGLRTLALRVERHGRSAALIAERLAAHPAVARVHLPGVTSPGAPGLSGVSGLLSFETRPGIDVERVCDAMGIFKLGVSWGGHESLVCPALVTLEQTGGPNHARFFGHPPELVRLSIGLEDPQSLWSDLAQALEKGRNE